MVAIAILTILSAITTIYFGTIRRNSRDAQRKAGAQTISSGITHMTVVAGTNFIKVTGQVCNLPDQINPANVPNSAANPGCVGASGRSYGKMNLKNATSSGYATNPGRQYTATTIGEALVGGGYLTKMPQDPLAQAGVFNNPNAPDYVLIRACTSGYQQVGSVGSLFGVWTPLENTPTSEESSNSDRYPGGKLAGPTGGSGTYIYDFAAQQTEWQLGAYYFKGFAVGNGITKVVASACSGEETAA